MWEEKEYINPFDEDYHYFWMKIEHLGRYLFAKDEISRSATTNCMVADFGCADGYGSNILATVARQVDAYDINSDYLLMGENNKNENVFFHRVDLDKPIELRQDKVDFVVAFEFLEHLENPNFVLEFINKILKENGKFICSVPNNLYEVAKADGKPSNPYHKHIYTQEEVIKLLNAHNLKIEKILGQAFPNIFAKNESKWARKKRLPFTSSTNAIFTQKEYLKYFGYMFAYPNELMIDKSYSYIYEVIKQK